MKTSTLENGVFAPRFSSYSTWGQQVETDISYALHYIFILTASFLLYLFTSGNTIYSIQGSWIIVTFVASSWVSMFHVYDPFLAPGWSFSIPLSFYSVFFFLLLHSSIVGAYGVLAISHASGGVRPATWRGLPAHKDTQFSAVSGSPWRSPVQLN